MKSPVFILALFLTLLTGCATRSTEKDDTLVSMQLLDRNGFSETISAKDRLSAFENTDFLAPQPYQKVLRVFGKASSDKAHSTITTYHPNGQLWQYLEVEKGRAHGDYREWHANGRKKLETHVIEGTPDINELAQMSWVFDGKSCVWDDEGHLVAEIYYEKGLLHGSSLYYHANGTLEKEIPYLKDLIHGSLNLYNTEGALIEKIVYKNGAKHGLAIGYWDGILPRYEELYEKDLLKKASYYDKEGKVVSEIQNGCGKQLLFQNGFLASSIEYKDGIAQGQVDNFSAEGILLSSYSIVDGKKNGDEWAYYPTPNNHAPKPKLFLQWKDDAIQGVVKTWYENGILESQREISGNKKHGLSFAWYKEGDLMLMEEYEDDHLIKGSYFKKWEKNPATKAENGKGIASLFDKDGRFLKKIVYEKGIPTNEAGF